MAEVEIPAGFVPQYAVAFGAVDAPAVAVHEDNPLPVRAVQKPAGSIPLTGTLTASGIAGPSAALRNPGGGPARGPAHPPTAPHPDARDP